MGEDGCDWFRWVFEDLPPNPSTLPQTSGPLKRRHSPSIEPSPSSPPQTSSSLKRRHSASIGVSSPSPALGHAREHQQVAPLLYARHHASSSRGSSKRHALDLSPSLPPQCHRTPSLKHPQPPRVWPFNFYADEMDIGFKKCRLESNKHWPVERVFSDYFYVKFTRLTFYDHRRHWMGVSQSVRERYIGYGHTEHGRWSTFLRQEIRGERLMGQTRS